MESTPQTVLNVDLKEAENMETGNSSEIQSKYLLIV